jgi:hypothetical protein
MTTTRQLVANRRNAQLSTGPRDTSRVRMNAQAHGILSSETVIRAGEGREDPGLFEALADSLRHDLAPDGVLEELLVDQIIALMWRLRRVLRYENAAILRAQLAQQDRAQTVELLLTSLPPEPYLQRVQRYESHLSREFYRALHELQRIQASRLQGVGPLSIAVDVDVASSAPADAA